jgi:hypothetical protein
MKSSDRQLASSRKSHASYREWWHSAERKAYTAARLAWWERECAHRWVQAADGSGLIPAPGQPKPVTPVWGTTGQPGSGRSRTQEEHEARVRVLRAHPEL